MNSGSNRGLVAVKKGIIGCALIVSTLLVTSVQLAFEENPEKLRKLERAEGAVSDKKKRKRKNSFDTFSVASSKTCTSSVDTLGNPTSLLLGKNWAMEEVCGVLQKQGDVFGIWKNRYFRLACLEAHELAEFLSLSESYRTGKHDRAFILFYWACDAKVALSAQNRYNPRGAYDLSRCVVEQDNKSSNKEYFTLSGLMDAMDENKRMIAPINLCAKSIRASQRWVSAFCFASIAPMFPRPSFDVFRPYPVSDMCDTLGVSVDKDGESPYTYYFRFYQQGYDAKSRAFSSSPKTRRFLLSWETEKQAVSKPITAQNIYEISDSTINLYTEYPTVLVLENVCDFSPMNQHKSFGKLYLKTKTVNMAVSWAKAISEDTCNIEYDVEEMQYKMASFENMQLEDDEEEEVEEHMDDQTLLHNFESTSPYANVNENQSSSPSSFTIKQKEETCTKSTTTPSPSKENEIVLDEINFTNFEDYEDNESMDSGDFTASSKKSNSGKEETVVDELSSHDILSLTSTENNNSKTSKTLNQLVSIDLYDQENQQKNSNNHYLDSDHNDDSQFKNGQFYDNIIGEGDDDEFVDDDYFGDDDLETPASFMKGVLENELNRLEPWQSPRPYRLSPVQEEELSESFDKRNSISSIGSSPLKERNSN